MDNVLTFTVHGGQANLTVDGGITTLTITGDTVRVEISVADAAGFSVPVQPSGTVAIPAAMPKRKTGREPYPWPANLERPPSDVIRAWARTQPGLRGKINTFGRLADTVLEAFVVAHTK